MDEPGTAGFFHLTSLSALTSRAQPPSRKSGEECALESGGTPSVGHGLQVWVKVPKSATTAQRQHRVLSVLPSYLTSPETADEVIE